MPITTDRADLAQRAIRIAAPIGFGVICLVLLGNRLEGVDAATVLGTMRNVTAAQWGMAILATAASFWAVGRYDAVVHRHLGTGVQRREALHSGAASIAIAQVLGMGVVTGALARWRMLPGLSAIDAARVSAVVAMSFLAGWAVVTALADIALPLNALPAGVAPLMLILAVGLVVTALLRPRISVFGRAIQLPTLRAMVSILALTALDTLFAAFALYILMPAGLTLGFDMILPAYLLALGAALLTGTPGGVGPFELALLALLPMVPEADLIGAIIAFRLVYYALPAVIALVPLARPRNVRRIEEPNPLGQISPAALFAADRAELGVARQNGALSLNARASHAAVVSTPQSLTLMFAPLQGRLTELLRPLRVKSKESNRIACLYKINARDAAAARSAGWAVVRIADEAVINPQTFTLDGSTHRQLRRKLRHAVKAGVVGRCTTDLPLSQMADVDAAWRSKHGQARGLTMGRFCPDYVAGQRVYLAEIQGRVVAYVSFHTGQREWTLDLMRHLPDLPDGTMQSLITAALTDAHTAGIHRLSLSALPARPKNEPALPARLRAFTARNSGGTGLIRFKSAFAPRLEPLYAASPTRAGLALALGDIALEIRRPSDAADTPQSIAFAAET
ncbi:MAG: phosphatidylglycerol lysyltransferase domain-containing protein [Pseudooceanicola sp.]